MNARSIRDGQGTLIAITGRYQRTDDARLRDASGRLPDNPDFVAAFLGGRNGRLRVGDQDVAFPLTGARPEVSRLTSTEECAGEHCITGESWLTHAPVYHSVGSRTRQSAGGTRIRSRACCRSGRLIRTSDGSRCRLKRPGAWEYDRRFGRLLPTGADPYVFTQPQSCELEVLSNQLTVTLRLLFGPSQSQVLQKVAANSREVEIGAWLITARLDLESQSIDDVTGVCGFHSSSHGGSTETRDGFTGDDHVLCR